VDAVHLVLLGQLPLEAAMALLRRFQALLVAPGGSGPPKVLLRKLALEALSAAGLSKPRGGCGGRRWASAGCAEEWCGAVYHTSAPLVQARV
jgi:hypothetical protein